MGLRMVDRQEEEARWRVGYFFWAREEARSAL
jgi:hypothetical protein